MEKMILRSLFLTAVSGKSWARSTAQKKVRQQEQSSGDGGRAVEQEEQEEQSQQAKQAKQGR